MSISVKIPQSQITKAVSAFSKYSKNVEARVKAATATTAINVHRKAVSTVVVDDSGLKTSINIGVSDDGETAVGSNKEYARRIEFGFFDMVDSLGRRFYQRAQPYLGPAAESERQPHRKRMIEALKPQ